MPKCGCDPPNMGELTCMHFEVVSQQELGHSKWGNTKFPVDLRILDVKNTVNHIHFARFKREL